jgi:hypothetical protein
MTLRSSAIGPLTGPIERGHGIVEIALTAFRERQGLAGPLEGSGGPHLAPTGAATRHTEAATPAWPRRSLPRMSAPSSNIAAVNGDIGGECSTRGSSRRPQIVTDHASASRPVG